MKYGKLRIAWSVVWGVVALLLCALWERSYSHLDRIGFGQKALTSMNGQLVTGVVFNLNSDAMKAGHTVSTYLVGAISFWTAPIGVLDPVGRGARYPYWPWPVAAFVFTCVPWLRWRFNLRSLLIVMTLVAVGLGWAVYTLRQ
jgi:hypothetical protein